MSSNCQRQPLSTKRHIYDLSGTDNESEIPTKKLAPSSQRQPPSTKQSMAPITNEVDDELEWPTATQIKPDSRILDMHMRAFEKDVDRAPAKCGQSNTAKLRFKFRREVNTPAGSPTWTLRDRDYFKYTYNHPVNWQDQESLDRLNEWRTHVIQRYCGETIRRRHVEWIVSEKAAVLTIVGEHLQHHNRMKWNRITNRFNLEAAGTIQSAGSQKVGRDGQGIWQWSASTTLIDRKAPWRPTRTVKAAAHRWPQYKALMETQHNKLKTSKSGGEVSANTTVSSDDDSELTDPGTKPDFKALKAQKVAMKKVGREKVRAKAGSIAFASGYTGPAKLTSATDGSGPSQRHSRGWGNAIAREDPNESGLTTSSDETDDDIAARIGNKKSTPSFSCHI